MNRSLLAVFICCFSLTAGAQEAGTSPETGSGVPLVTLGKNPVFTADDTALMENLRQRAGAYKNTHDLPQLAQSHPEEYLQ